ncbi:MAG: hypothetical protein Q7U02_07865 [Desulfosalsimonadaceae bacterium]|nr:hypothetical protein [Desulfosalsimonadaceae bacterium]
MDEINETNADGQDEPGTEPTETPDDSLLPEIVEGEAVEDSEDVFDEDLPEETGDLIEDAVRFINFTTKKMLADYALKVGSYLLTRFFNDDMFLASSPNHSKQVSFTKLCKRPDLARTRQDLGDMVRIAAQARVFQFIGVDITVLTYTHQRYLTQLPHSEAKLDLAMESIAQGTPSRVLYQQIQAIKQLSLLPPNAGQLQEKIITQYTATVTRFVAKAAMPDMFTDPEKLNSLEPEIRARLKATAARWITDLDAKKMEYQTLISKLEEADANPNC